MKISEMIESLAKYMSEKGDIEVVGYSPCGPVKIDDISYFEPFNQVVIGYFDEEPENIKNEDDIMCSGCKFKDNEPRWIDMGNNYYIFNSGKAN